MPVGDAQDKRDDTVPGAGAAELAHGPAQLLLRLVVVPQVVEDGVLAERRGHLQQGLAVLVDVGHGGGVLNQLDDALGVVGRDTAVRTQPARAEASTLRRQSRHTVCATATYISYTRSGTSQHDPKATRSPGFLCHLGSGSSRPDPCFHLRCVL